MVNFIIDDRLPSEVVDDPDTMKRFLIPSSLEFQRLWVEDRKDYFWFLILGTPKGPEYYELESKLTYLDTWKGFEFPVSLRKVGKGYPFDRHHFSGTYCKGLYLLDTMKINENLFMYRELQNECKGSPADNPEGC